MPTPQPPYTPNPPYPPARRGYGGDGVSPRKVILGLILVASVLVFFFILFAGAVAIVEEGSLRRGGHLPLMGAMKHVISSVIRLLHHH